MVKFTATELPDGIRVNVIYGIRPGNNVLADDERTYDLSYDRIGLPNDCEGHSSVDAYGRDLNFYAMQEGMKWRDPMPSRVPVLNAEAIKKDFVHIPSEWAFVFVPKCQRTVVFAVGSYMEQSVGPCEEEIYGPYVLDELTERYLGLFRKTVDYDAKKHINEIQIESVAQPPKQEPV